MSKAQKQKGGPDPGAKEARAGVLVAQKLLSAPAAPPWLQRWGLWIVAAAAILVYANTFQADFTLDDVPIVKENQRITSLKNIPLFFRLGYWQTAGEDYVTGKVDNYRPFTVTTYALNYAVNGLRPAGYHIVNVALHSLVSCLLFLLVLRVFETPRVAFVSALLFAVHPIHTEAVSGVVGRAEMLALLGIFVCCLGYENARRAAALGLQKKVVCWIGVSLGGYLVACFSKENGVIAPAVIFLWELLLPSRRWLLKRDWRAAMLFLGFVLVFGLFMSMRPTGPGGWTIHEGFVGVSTQQRIWTALRVCGEYVGLLLLPARLSADYWRTDVPIAASVLQPGVLIAIALLALGVFAFFRARSHFPGVSWGLAVFALALFPVSNLPFAIGIMKAERILYTPSAGMLVALAGLLPLLWKRPALRSPGWLLVWLVAGAYAARTWTRNFDWHDNHTLAMATLKLSPESPTFNIIMSRWYRDRNENQQAKQYLLKASAQNSRDPGVFFNLGNVELDEKRYATAMDYYNQALQIKSNHVDTLNNMGRVFHETGRFKEAAEMFNRVRLLRPNYLAAYINLVSAYFQMNDYNSALAIAEEAHRRFPDNGPILYNLGAIYKKLGRNAEADAALARAIQLDPRLRTTRSLKGAQ